MSDIREPQVSWHTPDDGTAPVVVLLHGRGSNEREIVGLADHLPVGPAYVALRAPIAEGSGFAWFANRGIGRPVPESLAEAIAWFHGWLEGIAPAGRSVVLVGFSGGATFAGGLVLDHPARFAGLATLYATLPFDAGVPTTPGRLTGVPVLIAQGDTDQMIPAELQTRTWEYLHGESGATVLARRSAGGHAITSSDVTALGAWIESVV